jgi:hypothetical protein
MLAIPDSLRRNQRDNWVAGQTMKREALLLIGSG